MKNKYIVIIVVLLLCFLGFIIFILGKKNNLESVVVVDNDLYLNYKGSKWSVSELGSVNWKKFDIYGKTDFVGSYYIVNNNKKFYFFDDANNSYEVNSPYIGFQEGSAFSIVNYEESLNYVYNDINDYLSKNNIDYSGEFSFYKKYIVDINNDQINDSIYLISNQLYTDDYVFIIFAKVNEKYITINFQDKYNDIVNYDLAWVINNKNSKYNDLIFNYYDFEQLKYNLFVYNTKIDGYKVVKY